MRWFPLAIRPDAVDLALGMLDRHMAPFLRLARHPIDPALIKRQKRNYSEALPKTLINSAVSLNSVRSRAFRVAQEIGLIRMLNSDSLRDFASKVSGAQLADDPGMQLIRYVEGDYVSPHNDHHPEYPNLRNGYIDLQITLSNDGVARQYFVYERNGLLNYFCNVGISSGISISMLPVWHQVTPLEAKPGRQDARRWLILVSFELTR